MEMGWRGMHTRSVPRGYFVLGQSRESTHKEDLDIRRTDRRVDPAESGRSVRFRVLESRLLNKP